MTGTLLRFLALFALLAGVATAGPVTLYVQSNLVSNVPALAATTDANLKNPWGVSFSATSPFWVANGGTNTATLYDGAGTPSAMVVTIPLPGSTPTGTVANGTTGFTLTPGNPARFVFAALDGSITGWNPSVNATNSITKVLSSPNNVYTGLAIASAGASTFLYAANFKTGHIDVFDSNFAPTSLAGNFTDPTLPSGFAPFNVEAINGNLYVTYAKVALSGEEQPGAGFGFVDVFNTNGNFVRRLISNGPLNAPWGIAIAPSVFGDYSNSLLVGNFGDGRIDAFNPTTGAFLGALLGPSATPLEIDGLWALKTRTGGVNVDLNAVYFTAGIHDEADGLFGKLTASSISADVPEPASIRTAGIALLVLAVLARRRRSGLS